MTASLMRPGQRRLQSRISAHLAIGPVEELDDGQAVRAGGLGGGQVGAGEVAGFGRQGLVELAGALALAVDLVVAEVAEDVGHGDSAGGRLAMLAAAVAVEVRGRLAVFFEQLLVAQGQGVVAAGGHVLAEHVAVGHLADDGMDPLVGEDAS